MWIPQWPELVMKIHLVREGWRPAGNGRKIWSASEEAPAQVGYALLLTPL